MIRISGGTYARVGSDGHQRMPKNTMYSDSSSAGADLSEAHRDPD